MSQNDNPPQPPENTDTKPKPLQAQSESKDAEENLAQQRPFLTEYVNLQSPNLQIAYRTILVAIPFCAIYFLLGQLVPSYPDFFAPAFAWLFNEPAAYQLWIDNYLTIPKDLFWNRFTLVAYLALYIGMWWSYFLSKRAAVESIDQKRLKIQTLRRLLGIASVQWNFNGDEGEDAKTVDNFRRKGEVGMMVIAVLIAATIIIFDQMSSLWSNESEHSLWQYTILWAGMLSLIISFVCLMLCVDSLDTMFNQFKNKAIRNTLIDYFYSFTINPRYAATAAMFFAMILHLAYYSEVLASIGVGIILFVGYNFWFPSLDQAAKLAGINTEERNRSFRAWCILPLFGTPIIVRIVTFALYA